MRKFEEILNRVFSIPELNDFIGNNLINGVTDLGLQLNKSDLSEIVFLKENYNFFKNKVIRERICSSLGLKINYDFKWGNQPETNNFLNSLQLEPLTNNNKDAIQVQDNFINPESLLHKYQNNIRIKLNNFLKSEEKKIIVHMPTGSGKTRTTIESICDYVRALEDSKKTFIWVAHSEELCSQALESFTHLWKRYGHEKADTIRLWGSSKHNLKEISRPTFVITSFQKSYSMAKTRSNEDFSFYNLIRKNCRLLIVDEAHQSTAPTYKDVIEFYEGSDTKIVGLTATPGRDYINNTDEATKELAKFYNNKKIDIVKDDGSELKNPIKYLTKKGVLSKIQHRSIEVNSNIELTELEKKYISINLDFSPKQLQKIGKNSQRTLLVATEALNLAITNKKQVIIFCPSKDNSEILAFYLRSRGCKAVSITGETNSKLRKESIESFKNGEINVLTNFGVLTTGFDSPNIDAVIVARPTLSLVLYSQMIGRGLRGPLMGGSAKPCELINVEDNIQNLPKIEMAFTFYNSFYE